MKNLFLEGITILYAFAGIICCIAYFPTIKDLFQQKSSANKTTYLLWTFTALITLLYSFFIIQDKLFRVISIANFVFCAIILFLSYKNAKANQKIIEMMKDKTM